MSIDGSAVLRAYVKRLSFVQPKVCSLLASDVLFFGQMSCQTFLPRRQLLSSNFSAFLVFSSFLL